MEARLLNGAIRRLRQGRHADRALEELDHYLLRFPGGILKAEARAARVDALLMLGREREALVALNALPLDGGGRDQELRVIRGELGAASDCARAILDFDQVLSTTASSSDLAERALYGRAVCRSRQGQKDEARRDAERYVERFPRGRFTREAQWLIASDGGDARDIDRDRRGP
jgi:tetratricopeptide (TPR) repeat protein